MYMRHEHNTLHLFIRGYQNDGRALTAVPLIAVDGLLASSSVGVVGVCIPLKNPLFMLLGVCGSSGDVISPPCCRVKWLWSASSVESSSSADGPLDCVIAANGVCMLALECISRPAVKASRSMLASVEYWDIPVADYMLFVQSD